MPSTAVQNANLTSQLPGSVATTATGAENDDPSPAPNILRQSATLMSRIGWRLLSTSACHASSRGLLNITLNAPVAFLTESLTRPSSSSVLSLSFRFAAGAFVPGAIGSPNSDE